MPLGPSSIILQPVNSDASVCRTIAGGGSSWLTAFDGSVAQGVHARVRIVSPAALPFAWDAANSRSAAGRAGVQRARVGGRSEMRERPLA